MSEAQDLALPSGPELQMASASMANGSQDESTQPPVSSEEAVATEEPVSAVEGNNEMSLEELQQELQVMEDEQKALAAELEQKNEPQLDSHLAVIEEQFRESFDDRFLSSGPRVRPQVWEDQTDMLRTNKIFREVSRDMGDEWRSVFADLMSIFPPEVLEEELAILEQQPAIIQGYKALMIWKEIAGPNFTIIKLVDSLRKNDMDDIADATLNILDEQDKNGGKEKKSKSSGKPVQRRKSDVSSKSKSAILDNRQMLLLAKQIGGDWEGVGKALAVPDEELSEIREEEGSTYQGAFKVIWSWRQTQPAAANEASLETLKTALKDSGKGHIAEQLGTVVK